MESLSFKTPIKTCYCTVYVLIRILTVTLSMAYTIDN